MTNRKDGGAAFPIPDVWMPNHEQMAIGHDGMSLRDWFAGMALQGMVQDLSRDHKEEYLAHDAYKFADAMLAEREKAGK